MFPEVFALFSWDRPASRQAGRELENAAGSRFVQFVEFLAESLLVTVTIWSACSSMFGCVAGLLPQATQRNVPGVICILFQDIELVAAHPPDYLAALETHANPWQI